ncbi:MAG: hypothetical protein RLN72_09470 [Henriciella sp.]
MKLTALLLAALLLAGCALDPYSTQPEVDIDPDKIDDPVPPSE